MNAYQRIENFFRPGFAALYYRKLIHAFDFFNLDYHLVQGYSFPPKSVCLILTEKCNLKCRMCDIGRLNAVSPEEDASPLVQSIRAGDAAMSLDDWLRLIDDLSLFSPRPLVLLTGTEPLLYPDISVIIDALTKKNIPLHITTNGTLLSHHASQIAEMCRHPYSIDITVSLDGIGEQHDEIRGVRGTFEKAMSGIDAIVKARKQHRREFPLINITCTVSQYNYTCLESFVAWLVKEKIPVASITFNHLWFTNASIAEEHNRNYGESFPAAEVNCEGMDGSAIDMTQVYRQIHAIRHTYGSAAPLIYQQPELSLQEALMYYKNPCQPLFYNKCTAAWRNVTVTPKGNVILSPLCFFPPAGNVRERRFSEIWNGTQLRQLRRFIKTTKMFPACFRCCMLFGSKPKYYKLKDWLV